MDGTLHSTGSHSPLSIPGVMSVHRLSDGAKRMVFVNGFAATEPQSSSRVWNCSVERYGKLARRVALINCRADREGLSARLADACRSWRPVDEYLVIGSGTDAFARRLIAAGVSVERVTCLENTPLKQLFEEISNRAQGCGLVVGTGNVTTPAMELVELVQSRSRRPAQAGYAWQRAA